MGIAVEPNPNRPFLPKFRLLKVDDLIAVKITCTWPKIKGEATPYLSMDEIMN
jgi:hypothetical protein